MMGISISNIAWDVDGDVIEILKKYRVEAIDIAPTKYFPRVNDVSDSEILSVKEYWNKKGINIIGMQSLLFGTQGLNVFGSDVCQESMLSHLSRICYIGKLLGSSKLVFGSPRNRDRAHLSDSDTRKVATSFFRKLGDIAKKNRVCICLEPNPACYGSNFMVDSIETVSIVEAINHPNIKMQLDIGAMLINDECPEIIIPKIQSFVGHIHISEPKLAVIDVHNDNHHIIAPLLKRYLPEMDVTIEMLTTDASSCLSDIEKSIKFVSDLYTQGSKA